MSDIERDILLADLREAYTELKFGAENRVENSTEKVEEVAEQTPIIPIAPTTPNEPEEDDDEPEVEVELIFNEEEDDDEEIEETAEEPIVEPVVEEPAIAEQTPITPIAPSTTPAASPKRSALLSLYEENSTPVIGEQFHETPSVADTITWPKGVAESAAITSLREAIGVADRFMLLEELFDNDITAYETAIDNLDSQPSLEDCLIFISENYAWRSQSQGAQYMMKLLQRRFE
jgi:hypothetical protein